MLQDATMIEKGNCMIKKKNLPILFLLLAILVLASSCDGSTPSEPFDYDDLIFSEGVGEKAKYKDISSFYLNDWPIIKEQISYEWSSNKDHKIEFILKGSMKNDLEIEYRFYTTADIVKVIEFEITDGIQTLRFNPLSEKFYGTDSHMISLETAATEYKHLYENVPTSDYFINEEGKIPFDKLYLEEYVLGDKMLAAGYISMYSYISGSGKDILRNLSFSSNSKIYYNTISYRENDHVLTQMNLEIRYNTRDQEWRILSFSNNSKSWTYDLYLKYGNLINEYIEAGAFTYFGITE